MNDIDIIIYKSVAAWHFILASKASMHGTISKPVSASCRDNTMLHKL